MENTSTTAQATPAAKTRNCDHCGKEYAYNLASSRFCSSPCRAANAKKNPRQQSSMNFMEPQQGNAPVSQQSAPDNTLLSGLGKLQQMFFMPPHAQYMIDHLKKEADRWENRSEEERKKREKAEEELKQLKLDMEKQQNPGGLQGFAEKNPDIIGKLIDVLGPKVASLIPEPSPQQQIAGPGGNGLTEPLQQLIQWTASMPPETQESFWQMIGVFMQTEDFILRDTIQKILMNLNYARTGS
jgi:hypothetical protein